MKLLTRERLKVYPRIILILYILVGGYMILLPALLGHGLVDRMGKPVGADFAAFWTASKVALAKEPATIYDLSKFQAIQKSLIGAEFPLAWFYPPTFLLIVLPLSLLPYLASLVIWHTITLSGYLFVIRRIATHPSTIWLTLSFPATFQNFIHGQNGFMSASLIGGGLLLLDSSPVLGGLLLGIVSYKPQLAALIPIALIAGRRWKALAAAAASAIILALASLLVFGLEVWITFIKNLSLPIKLVKLGALPVYKMPTVFSATLVLSGSSLLASILQGMVMLAVAATIIWTWSRQGIPLARRASVLVLGILLFTPFAFDYDLTLLALPLAWLAWEGYTEGWPARMQGLLFLGWLMPIIAPLLAKLTHLQVGPMILAVLLIFALGLSPNKTGSQLRAD
jgi:alpha-1,2-mannosyltransferase